jgi:KDO2-lipid IV(A) lauroyltransferase
MPPVLGLLHRLVTLPLIGLIARIPADTADRAGAALGVLCFHLGLRRRVVSGNLGRALGLKGSRRRAVARRSYATMGANFLNVWTFGQAAGPEAGVEWMAPAWVAHLHRHHPGRVMLTLHLGSWDVAGHAGATLSGKVMVYAKAQHDPLLDAELNRARGRAGMEVLFARHGERTAAVTALRALRAGRTLGLLADQMPGAQEGVPAWFLGVPTSCHGGPAVFSRRGGVPVVPGFCLRVAAGRYAMFYGRPLPACADDGALIQAGMDRLSAIIAAFPGQYFWHHRRFKRPIDLPPRPSEPWRTRGLRLLVDR